MPGCIQDPKLISGVSVSYSTCWSAVKYRSTIRACRPCTPRSSGDWSIIPPGYLQASRPGVAAVIPQKLIPSCSSLSTECKDLLCRMLVTDPANRATLAEVIASPWLNKGFEEPTDSYLVPREPLRPEELDPEVLRGMAGFEFGTEDHIRQRMSDLLTSETYRRVHGEWETRRSTQRKAPREWEVEARNREVDDGSGSLPMSPSGGLASPSKGKPAKRFSGFDFYKKGIFKNSSMASNAKDDATPGRMTAPGRTLGDDQEYLDPTRGFHPLISIYYLVREKLERERVYGPGLFASSELSLTQTPGAIPNGAPGAPNSRAPAYGMALPRLSVPETSHMPARGSESVRAGPPSSVPGGFDPQPLPRNRGESLNQRADRVNELRAAGVMQHPEEDFDRSRLDQVAPNLPSSVANSSHRRSYSMNGGMSSPTDKSVPRMVSSASQNVKMDNVVDEDLIRDTQGLTMEEQDFVREPESLPTGSFETTPSASRSGATRVDPRTQLVDSSAEGIISDHTPNRASRLGPVDTRTDQTPSKIDAKPVYLKGLFR